MKIICNTPGKGREVERIVKHIDGVTSVNVKGKITNGVFTGEYRYKGMTYGVNIPLVKFNEWINLTEYVRDAIYDIDNKLIKIKTTNGNVYPLNISTCVWAGVSQIFIQQPHEN